MTEAGRCGARITLAAGLAILIPSLVIRWAYHVARRNARPYRQLENACIRAKNTHHMSRASDSHESKQRRLLRLAGLRPPCAPVAPLLYSVLRLPAPVKLVDPQLVRDPVTLPVVRAGIDEDTDTSVEKIGDVVLGVHRPFVHMCVEASTDVI